MQIRIINIARYRHYEIRLITKLFFCDCCDLLKWWINAATQQQLISTKRDASEALQSTSSNNWNQGLAILSSLGAKKNLEGLKKTSKSFNSRGGGQTPNPLQSFSTFFLFLIIISYTAAFHHLP